MRQSLCLRMCASDCVGIEMFIVFSARDDTQIIRFFVELSFSSDLSHILIAIGLETWTCGILRIMRLALQAGFGFIRIVIEVR